MEEDTFGDLVIDFEPPELLMEDDDEVELCIVRPIIENLISEAVDHARFKDLQKLVEINMEEVALEEMTNKKMQMIQEIIDSCITLAVKESEITKGVSLPETVSTQCSQGQTHSMGTIELCNDNSSSDEEDNEGHSFKKAKKVDLKASAEDRIRKVAKVFPFEANEEDVMSDEGESIITINEFTTSNSPSLSIGEDPFAGIESSETLANVNDEPTDDSRRPSGSGLGLRLRNFAVDPAASNSLHDALPCTTSAQGTWHMTEGFPYEPTQQQQSVPISRPALNVRLGNSAENQSGVGPPVYSVQPAFRSQVDLPFIKKEYYYCYQVLSDRSGGVSQYAIFTSRKKGSVEPYLKIFLPWSSLRSCIVCPDNWNCLSGSVTNVAPGIVSLTLDAINYTIFQLHLLRSVDRVLEAVKSNGLFAIHASDIRDINASTVQVQKLALIHFAIDNFCNANSLMCIDLSKYSEPYATLLFEYFQKHGGPHVSDIARKTTRIRLQLILKLFGRDPLNAGGLEQSIFNRCNGMLQFYESTLYKEISTMVENLRMAGNTPRFNIRFPLSAHDTLKVCEFCDFTYSGNDEKLYLHLSRAHFGVKLSKMARQSSCAVNVNCSLYPPLLAARIEHLGVYHRLAKSFLETTIANIGPLLDGNLRKSVLKCPVPGCIERNKSFSISHFIHHATDHLHTVVSSKVRELQNCQCLSEDKCPIDGCDVAIKCVPSVQLKLMQHVAIDHFGILAHLCLKFDLIGDHSSKNLMRVYAAAMTGEDSVCNDCQAVFGNQTELRHHRAVQHITGSLIQCFEKNSSTVGSKKICFLCANCSFNTTYVGAIHYGVVHIDNGLNVHTSFPNSAPESSSMVTVRPIVVSRHQNPAPKPAGVLPSLPSWYYQCPICAEKINADNDRAKSVDKLVVHLVTIHENGTFSKMLDNMNFHCPTKDCSKSFSTTHHLRSHVLRTHITYLNDFLKKFMKGLCIKDCFVQTTIAIAPPPPHEKTANSNDDIIFVEETHNPLIEQYIKYCNDRKTDPFTCPPHVVNCFINYAFASLKFSKSDIQAAIVGIEKRHSCKTLSSHPLLVHTLSILSTAEPAKASRKEKASSGRFKNEPTKKASYDRVFICSPCSKDFSSVRDLSQHLHDVNHKEIIIGCKLCDFKTTIADAAGAERFLVFHTFSKVHLYNRWLKLTAKGHQGEARALTNAEMTLVRCEVCSEEVTDLQPHATSQKHKNNAFIVNHFVAHCDLRQICPVTCSTEEIIFYLDYLYPKTLVPTPERKLIHVTIFSVLGVLSKIHDPLADGQDVTGNMTIASHIQQLIAAGSSVQIAKFICYPCSYFAKNYKALEAHVNSNDHTMKKSQHKSNQTYRCEVCNKIIEDFYQVELHSYSVEHITNENAEFAGYGEPLKRFHKPDNFCYICKVTVNDEKHAETSIEHKSRKVVLDKYLRFCKANGHHPLNSGSTAVSSFVKQLDGQIPAIKLKAALTTLELQNLLPKLIPNSASSAISGSSTDDSLTVASSSKPKFEPYGMDQNDEELVTRCPVCNIKYNHATYLLYHLLHIHKRKPSNFVMDIMGKAGRLYTCGRCMKRCYSPIILALHHDRHQTKGKHLTCPHHCKKNFTSPAAFYANDTCKANSLPETVKREVDKVILKAVERSPFSAVIGCKDNLARFFKETKKRPRNSDDEDILDELPNSKKSKSISGKKLFISSDDDSDFEPDNETVVEEYDDFMMENLDDLSGGSSSRSSVPEKEHLEENSLLNVAAMGARVLISAQDQDRANRALRLLKLKSVTGPCSVVIKVKGSGLKVPIEKTSSNRARSRTPNPEPSCPVKREPITPPIQKQGKKPGPKSKQTNSLTIDQPSAIVSKPAVKKVGVTKPKDSSSAGKKKPGPKPKLPGPKSRKITDFLIPAKEKSPPPAPVVVKEEGPTVSPSTGKTVFCLNCEGCGQNCTHMGHPRRMVADKTSHVIQYNHGRYQDLDAFLDAKVSVSLNDVAYHYVHGHKVRKSYKKYAIAMENVEGSSKLNLYDYDQIKNCKFKDCSFKSSSIVYMFRHIRQEHLLTIEDHE